VLRSAVIAVAFAATSFIAAGQAIAETAVIGVPNWPSARVTAHVIKALAEKELGVEVTLAEAFNDEIFAGMGLGDGTMDVHPEVWMPNQEPNVAKYVEEAGSVVLTPLSYDAIQGVCIRREVSEELGVTSIHQLADPAIAAQLDSDGDGRGDIWLGAEGWVLTTVERIKAKSYGYDQTLKLLVSEEADMLARLDASAKQGRPFVFSCYGPHHMFQVYDLVLLEEPAYDPARWNVVQPADDPAWLEKSSVDVAWPKVTVHIAYSTRLREVAPELADMLDRMQMNSRMVSGWTYAIEVDKADPAAFAAKWIKSRPGIVNGWLGR